MENEIIANANNGCKNSQEKIYFFCKNKVKKYINCKYPNNIDIEDDTSEIIIKVFQNLNKFNDEKSKFETWLINLSKNYMIDKERKKNIKFSFSLNNNSNYNEYISNMVISSNEPSQDDILTRLDITDLVDNKVSKTDINLFFKKYIEGYSFIEIAKEENISLKKLTNKVSYIRKKIKNKVS